MTVSCHCGGVSLRLDHAPDEISQCNCSLCTQTGFRGIYYRLCEVTVTGEVAAYVRRDLDPVCLTMWRCACCGVATHWTPLGLDDYDRMGVNGRLLDPDLADRLPVRIVDGKSW